MQIYVAGHEGLVGRAITRAIDARPDLEWIGASHQQLDLLDGSATLAFLEQNLPDMIIIAAAKVGGISANDKFPVEFLVENLTIQNNIMKAAHEVGTKSLVFLGSACIYPKFCEQPIKEEYLLTGTLEPTNEAYAIAKIAGLKLIQSYRREYGHSWISVMPTNLYGPDDNFDLETSHVLPAMIAKCHKAKIDSASFVELWGTGTPRREFLHVDDLADAILLLAMSYDDPSHINIGCGVDIELSEVAAMIAKIVGFTGEIIWNTQMPDGTPKKRLDISKLSALGWEPKIELSEGIKSVYESYLESQSKHFTS
jgi:GDP-L-fucose synthase